MVECRMARAWRTLALCFGLAALSLVTPSAAFADGVDAATKKAAAAEASKASKALGAQSYKTAAEGFESAFSKYANYTWLFNAATARQRNGDVVRAANEYARFLAEAPEKDKNRATAKTELANLATMLGRVDLKADGASQVTIDGQPADMSTMPIYVLAGTHTFEAKYGDKTVSESPTIVGGQMATVVLAKSGSGPAPAAAAGPEEKPEPAPAKPALGLQASTTSHKAKPLPPTVVWIGGGATLVLGGLSVVSGLDVLSQRDTFENDRSQDNLDEGKKKQLRTNVLLIATGVVGAITATLAIAFVDWSRFTDPQATPKTGLTLPQRLLRGTF